MDRGARWATVHRVTKNRTRLKQLSMHAQGPKEGWTDSLSLLICSFPHFLDSFLSCYSQDRARSACPGFYRPRWPWLFSR